MVTAFIALLMLGIGTLVGLFVGSARVDELHKRPFPCDLRAAVLLRRSFLRGHPPLVLSVDEVHKVLVRANDLFAEDGKRKPAKETAA